MPAPEEHMRESNTSLESPFLNAESWAPNLGHDAYAAPDGVLRESPFERFPVELRGEAEEEGMLDETARAFTVRRGNVEILGESTEMGDVAELEMNGELETEWEGEEETFTAAPYADELEEEDLGALEIEDEELHRYGETEESEQWEEEFEAPQPAAYDARIVNNKDRINNKPAEVALIVDRWGAGTAKTSGVRLKLYECDVRESGRSDAASAKNVQMAELTFDLVPSPERLKTPAKAGIPHVLVTNAKWASTALEKSYKATAKADVILWLGSRAFPLWVPRDDIMEEGNAVELGFVLEDGQGQKVQGQAVRVAIPDYLAILLAIPGRFDDPHRDPAVDMDGTKFDEFLKGKDRRAFVAKWLDEHAALKDAASEPNADLKTTDIVKAWFVIHDVGVGASVTDRRFKASQPATKNGAVHGFVNRGGYYAATHDFTRNRQGTVYEFLSRKGLEHVNGRTINLETVPDIEPDVPDQPDGSRGEPSNAGQYASIGYKRKGNKVTYYKWTNAAFDVLADLYLFASARARHLLTITAHKEMDRNLGRSVIWREYSAAEMRAGTGKHWDTARNSPSNYHGDPYGFDMQALYDIITRKLNALGGRQMPAGARYGIHPRRVCKDDGEDIVNGSNHLHVFPHQSSPQVSVDGNLKKTGWWNA
jgi:hypothetical protein